MVIAQPHYLLFCDTQCAANAEADAGSDSSLESRPSPAQVTGRWHFVLEQLDGPERLEAADSERSIPRDRLALLSVVRGLEAIEQPSRVTLVTTSRYVSRGLRYGLSTWRDSEYKWERFGERLPIRNSDLWRRIDGAMQFHGISCKLIQSDSAPSMPSTAAHPAIAACGAVANPTVQPLALPALTAARSAGPKLVAGSSLPWQQIWWTLAASWLKWWRARTQFSVTSFGT